MGYITDKNIHDGLIGDASLVRFDLRTRKLLIEDISDQINN